MSISIDKELDQIRRNRKDLNFSGLVNRLLHSYFKNNSTEKAGVETQIALLEQEKQRVQRKQDEIQTKIKTLQNRIEENQKQDQNQKEILQRFAKRVDSGNPLTQLNYDYIIEKTGLTRTKIDKKIWKIIDQESPSQKTINPEKNAIKTIARQIQKGHQPDPDEDWIQYHSEKTGIEPVELIHRAKKSTEK